MLRQDVDEEDLRTEIYSLRKHITRVCSENQILKVKIRKLQDEMIKRDKQLDEFLQSKRCFGLPKNLQEKGASVFMNLKEKNVKLEQSLLEKDMMIKRLQNNLQTARLYNTNYFHKKFVSKGVECNLHDSNRMEYQKKNMDNNNKIELHMPNFEMGDFKSSDEIYRCKKGMNDTKTKKVESELLIDLNLKQRTVPSYLSETTFERCTAYHVEAKGSKSDSHVEELSEEYIPMERKRQQMRDLKSESLEDLGRATFINPVFKKILDTIESLMRKSTNTDFNISRILTIDESVQFPSEASGGRQIVKTSSDRFELHDQNSDMERMLLNERPPSILDEMQQSDGEVNSECEKVDRMEKTMIRLNSENFIEGVKPHEEMKELHIFLMDMISQVDSLKDTISKMKADQEKTETDLRSKDQSIDKLAKEIEELRELRSFSSLNMGKNIDIADKMNPSVDSYEIIQKTTRKNIKKIAGKIKHLRDSESSISSHTKTKTSRSSSKNSKPDKRKTSEKSNDKLCRRSQGPEFKKPISICNIDVGIPFYRCGFAASSVEDTTKNEFDELD